MNQMVKRHQYEDGLDDAKERFEVLASGHLSYGDEEIFAMQALTKNDYTFKIANANPRSVQLAMINVASTGLTLNPAYGYAYLVPRDGAIVLDISYKGLIKIATDAGAIVWVRAECVHEKDVFAYRGPAIMPEIKADPFQNRGEIIGAYCIAKTKQGDILVEVMDLASIEQIRNASTAWTKGGKGSKGPWESYFPEMCRKAVIKRARKTWPYTDQNERLAKAVEIANEAEGGYTFEAEPESGAAVDAKFHTKEAKADRAEQRVERHRKAADRNSESITLIKERIEAGDLKAAVSEWLSLDEGDRAALWLSTEKGGTALTNDERQQISDAKAILADDIAHENDRAAERAAQEMSK